MWVTANGAGAPNSASDDRCYPHPLRTVLAATSLYRLLLPSKLRVEKMRDQVNVAVELNLVFGVASQEINLLTEKIRSKWFRKSHFTWDNLLIFTNINRLIF